MFPNPARVLPLVVVGFIWELQYAPTDGFINNALGLVKSNHIIDWLGDPRINLNAWQTFFRVVFPVMMPINVVIAVITTIESLRAFDIAYIINRGKNGLELLSTLIVNNSISEANLIGFGSAIAVVLLVISLVPIVTFLVTMDRRIE